MREKKEKKKQPTRDKQMKNQLKQKQSGQKKIIEKSTAKALNTNKNKSF